TVGRQPAGEPRLQSAGTGLDAEKENELADNISVVDQAFRQGARHAVIQLMCGRSSLRFELGFPNRVIQIFRLEQVTVESDVVQLAINRRLDTERSRRSPRRRTSRNRRPIILFLHKALLHYQDAVDMKTVH